MNTTTWQHYISFNKKIGLPIDETSFQGNEHKYQQSYMSFNKDWEADTSAPTVLVRPPPKKTQQTFISTASLNHLYKDTSITIQYQLK